VTKQDDNRHGPESRIRGTSLESFTKAADAAFNEVPGDPNQEGFAEAEVARLTMSKGGVVGRTQYHVELSLRDPADGG
jgi:hypothetical protein